MVSRWERQQVTFSANIQTEYYELNDEPSHLILVRPEAVLNLAVFTGTTHKTTSAMKVVPPNPCLKDYRRRRNAFKELIATTPNVPVRAKEGPAGWRGSYCIR